MKAIIITLLVLTNLYPYSMVKDLNNNFQENRVIEYIKTEGPLNFNSELYYLRWSANPSKGYFKQEYLQKKDTYLNFNKMLLIEYQENIEPIKALKNKVDELNLRKKTDPIVNYDIAKSPDGTEFIIDFLVSDKNIFEWNIYKIVSKKNGSLLFAFSLKSSEKGEFSRDTFLEYLKINRTLLINKMIQTKIPDIELQIK